MSKADTAGARLPKQVGGVTVPKRLRPTAGRLLTFLNHPLVGETIAAALVAGAGALAQRKSRSEVAKAVGLGAAAAAVKASRGTNRLGVAVLVALAEVAVAGLAKRANSSRRG